jgi:hypothetical protein
MRSRSVTLAVSLAVLAVASALGSHLRSTHHQSEARWLLERGNAQAEEYAHSFDPAAADRQVQVFEARREVLSRVLLWQQLRLLFSLVAVVAGLCAYVLHLWRRLREDLDEAEAELEERGPSAFPSPLAARK